MYATTATPRRRLGSVATATDDLKRLSACRSPRDDVEDVPMLRAEERIPVLVLLIEREELEAVDKPAHGIDVDESH